MRRVFSHSLHPLYLLGTDIRMYFINKIIILPPDASARKSTISLPQIYDHIIKYEHEQLRMYGYHEFYRATIIHKGIPLHIVSLWNTVILCIQTIMQHQYGSDFFDHCTKSFFSPTTYICLFCTFETILLLAVHGTYMLRVKRFNDATMPPDAFRGLSPSMNSVSCTTYESSLSLLSFTISTTNSRFPPHVTDITNDQSKVCYYLIAGGRCDA